MAAQGNRVGRHHRVNISVYGRGPIPSGAVDESRRLVVERGLAGAAFGHLTVDAFLTLPLDAVGPTKALLKRYFSTDEWGPADDDALAAAVGPGEGQWRRDLDADVVLDYGWIDGRFGVRVETAAPAEAEAEAAAAGVVDPLAGTFDGPVVPEATPNPRSIRFQVGPIHRGPSRWYESAAAAADDPGPARLFAEFGEVANVLVGPDFVAVGLCQAADWERLLRPVLDVVTDEFADPDAPPDTSGPRVMGGPAGAGVVGVGDGGGRPLAPDDRRASRLDRAWADLGSLRPGADADDLARVRSAAAGDDPSHRQVAANLLGEADPTVAADDWARLVVDRVRSVRRAAVDAVVDAGREELGQLLETALADADAWVRWKALRGPRRPRRRGQPGRHRAPGRRPRLPDSPGSGRRPPSGRYSQTWVKMAVTVPAAVVSDSDPYRSGPRPPKTTLKLSPPNSGGRPGMVSCSS